VACAYAAIDNPLRLYGARYEEAVSTGLSIALDHIEIHIEGLNVVAGCLRSWAIQPGLDLTPVRGHHPQAVLMLPMRYLSVIRAHRIE
jgi:hypothetical protein